MFFDNLITELSKLLSQNLWLGFLIAFVAGLLTFFTPCSLTSVPMVVGYVGGTGATRKKAFVYSVFVVLGETIIFAGIGLLFALLYQTMSINYILIGVFYIIMGLFMFWMALEMWGVTDVFSKLFGVEIKTTKKGIWGAFLIGLLGGVFASPCDAPVLTAIAALMMPAQGVSAGLDAIIAGVVMFLMYALGRGIPLVVVGTSIGFAQRLASSDGMEKTGKIVKIILGILIFALGAYILYTGVTTFL